MSVLDSPVPLSDIESILAWVDTFKLTKPTKKINRDFSDAVLLAEILSVHYPKLVEMHNYPPRNNRALKLNNWSTLNRKVLKKIKLNLCNSTMEQLANCTPGIIERVLIMVRDKIRRDEEVNKSAKDLENNMSSGGSYYEACGDDEHVLVVPVRTRVNGVLETVQQKVVSHETYLGLKEELKDAKDSNEVLLQKVEHLDALLKLKEERIEELQKQLERKQTRRKEVEAFQNSLSVPLDQSVPPTPKITEIAPALKKSVSQINEQETIITKTISPKASITEVESKQLKELERNKSDTRVSRNTSEDKVFRITSDINVDKVKSDIFREIEITDDKNRVHAVEDDKNGVHAVEEFKDPEQTATIEQTIMKEVNQLSNPNDFYIS